MQTFNALDYYWQIAGSTTAVYSSKRNVNVPLDDADYQAWLAVEGNFGPRQIQSEAELWDVLAQRAPGHFADWMFDGTTFVQPAMGQYTKAQLTAYAAAKRYDVEVGGITISAMPIATDRQSQAMINGAYSLAQSNSSMTLSFKTKSGFATLNAAQVIALGVAVADHVQACFSKEASVGAAIAAGTITDLAGIDAQFVGI